MIKYQLKCQQDHQFEGWFSNSDDYDQQEQRQLLTCPVCGNAKVEKALMAPAVARSGSLTKTSDTDDRVQSYQEEIIKTAQKAREYVEKNFDHVGKQFPEEARRIHYGETQERAIYGEAEPQEVKELIDEGVSIAPLPSVPNTAEEIKKKLN